MARPGDVDHKWVLVDASGQVLGRLAVQVARVLMGKHRPTYTPHVDTGDFVIVTNAAGIRVTGASKPMKRNYQSYSRHPGGQKVVTLEKMLQKDPEHVIREAVRRMLPKNTLARQMLKKLKIYDGPTHPHQAQQPEVLEIQ